NPNASDLMRVPGGPLLIAMPGGISQLAGDKVEAYPIRGVDRPYDAGRLLRDRDGSLWIATVGRGLLHVHDGRTDQFTRADGLSGDLVRDLYEDREGNVWVATSEGLDRFRQFAVATLSTRQGLSSDLMVCVLPARDGGVWLGSTDGVIRWNAGRTTIYRTREGIPDDHVTTLFEDTTGRIFVSTLGGVATFDCHRF